MRLAVLGAAGAMADVVLRDLAEFAPEAEVTAADLRPFQPRHPRARYAPFDARDVAGTARLLAGHDAVLNCVTYYHNVPLMQAALTARVPYTDLGGLYHESRRQFELDDAFRAAGVPALLGMGSTPGITNAMAGKLAEGLDEVEELHVRVGCHDPAAAGPLPIPYALDTVLDEFQLAPQILLDGEPRAVRPMSGEEEIDFPPPVGRMRAIYTLHSEVAMFPRSYPGLRAASFKVAFAPEFVAKLRFLVELGFADREPAVAGVSPRQMLLAMAERLAAPAGEARDCDAIRVEIRGQRGGRTVRGRGEAVIHPHPVWKVAAGALDTGVPLAIAGLMLARGEIATPGVHCPETALPLARFFAELERRGIIAKFDLPD